MVSLDVHHMDIPLLAALDNSLLVETVQMKTSRVHNFKFVSTLLYSFCCKRSTKSKFEAQQIRHHFIIVQSLSFLQAGFHSDSGGWLHNAICINAQAPESINTCMYSSLFSSIKL